MNPRKRLAALIATLALAAIPGASAVQADGPTATAAKRCSAGYVHASLSWGHKCLRRGQYCKRSGDGEYHRYGFHCHGQRLS